MSFGGNTQPKKKKKPVGSPWVCGCGVAQPHYLVRCSRCGKGQTDVR